MFNKLARCNLVASNTPKDWERFFNLLGIVILLNFLMFCKKQSIQTIARFKKKRGVGIFWITFDRYKIESCGFHHSRENSAGHKSMLNLIGPAVNQSSEFLKTFRPMKFLKHFYIWFLVFRWPSGRKKCSLSIYARPTSLFCSFRKL